MRLSIIIVNYNVTELLRNCLLSVEKYVKELAYEVIVVDNNSEDASWKKLKAEFPSVNFLENTSNEGFAKANNKCVQVAQGEYLLLLNPDTELEGPYLKEILYFADTQPKLGCLGVRLHDAEGNFLPECKRSVPDLINSFEKLFLPFSKSHSRKNYYRNDIAQTAIAEVEVITGAFLLMKKDLYLKMGGLDERYFMYGEDIDLCYTLLREGYSNWYYGKHAILHIKGESTEKDLRYLKIFYGAMQIFISKYYRDKPLQYLALKWGLSLRYFFASLAYGIKKAFR